MSSIQRFFFTEHELAIDQQIDLRVMTHQLQVVLRLRTGAQVVLLDGKGRAFLTEVNALTRKEVTGRVLAELPAPPEPTVHVTLYQSTLKADKFEWVLQKATELGVACIVPVISQRSIVRPATTVLKKYERWQLILREAAEQCGRGRIPELAPPLDWPAAITDAQGLRLFPWEEQTSTSRTIQAAMMPAPPAASHDQSSTIPNLQSVSLLIGPEGGITDAEAQAAQEAGWQTVSLGPRILRAETAAIASLVLVMAQLEL